MDFNALLELIKNPWPWWVAGPMIGLTVPILLLIGNKSFGISSSLRHTCAIIAPGKIPFFQYNWKKEVWNMLFVLGIFFGGMLAALFLTNPNAMVINPDLAKELAQYGITDFSMLTPFQIMSWDTLFSLKGLILMVGGGFLVGFGTRYAGGCTSGHAIMGLSTLQLPSLIATCCFMASGFLTANFLLPLILAL
jgi:uncharacterized membrane protein YedE/YeeE